MVKGYVSFNCFTKLIASFNIFFLFITFMPSKTLSLVLALTLNFTINRNFTFLARSGRITKQFIRYMIVYAIAITVNLTVSFFLNAYLGNGTINANIATATGIAAAIRKKDEGKAGIPSFRLHQKSAQSSH